MKIERGVERDEDKEGRRERVRQRGGWGREKVCENLGGGERGRD